MDRYKLQAFIISPGIDPIAVAMKSIVFQVAALADVHWSMSGHPILVPLVGGLGTIFGPVLGTLHELLRRLF